jgi:hypothetical protein
MKFKLENSIRIILYSLRKIEKGETLYYNYNNGCLNEDDTSKFILKEKLDEKFILEF